MKDSSHNSQPKSLLGKVGCAKKLDTAAWLCKQELHQTNIVSHFDRNKKILRKVFIFCQSVCSNFVHYQSQSQFLYCNLCPSNYTNRPICWEATGLKTRSIVKNLLASSIREGRQLCSTETWHLSLSQCSVVKRLMTDTIRLFSK